MLTDHSGTAPKTKGHVDVRSFVLTPVDEGDLRLKWKTCLKDLHIAMELNHAQFMQLIYPLRNLASHMLDVSLPFEQQDGDKWNKFVAEACEREPFWRAKYENAWPITTYLWRYLYNRAADNGNLTRSTKDPDFKPPPRHRRARKPASTTGRATGRGVTPNSNPYRHQMRGRRHTPSVRENISPASTKSRAQSYHHDFEPAEQLINSAQVAERGVSPHVSSPTISSLPPARLPFARMLSNHAYEKGSPVLSESMTQKNKENATCQLPSSASTSSLDPSAPVREFLCHLGDDLGALLPVFVKKGIKDGATLSEFRKMRDDDKAKFLANWKELDDFQLFRLVAVKKQG